MKTLIDTPDLRAKRHAAYVAGKYKFNPPPVCTAMWDDQAWHNWVIFDNPKLTGFLQYQKLQCSYKMVPCAA